MHLPFKEDKPDLPNNKGCAIHHYSMPRNADKRWAILQGLCCLYGRKTVLRRCRKHTICRNRRSPCLVNTTPWDISSSKAWENLCIFDCSAKFQGTSLNNHLLVDPELTNALVGVLCRFREGLVAVMCDIERMFHQFRVKAEDQEYLRFLWWDKWDLESEPLIYRMKPKVKAPSAKQPFNSLKGISTLMTGWRVSQRWMKLFSW